MAVPPVLGTVTQLWRFPVKSMQGEQVAASELGPQGLTGDRGWAVRDTTTGKVLSAKRVGALLSATARRRDGMVTITLPDGQVLAAGEPATDAALSAWLDRPVRLAEADPADPGAFEMTVDPLDEDAPLIELPCPPGTFLDAAAAHLLTTASLAAAARLHPTGSWDVRRFRPTMLIETGLIDPAAGEEWVEDAWIGTSLAVGDAALTVFAPTVRCAMPTRSQGDLPADADIARTVTTSHNSNLGVYAAVTAAGAVAVGDTLTPLTD